MASVMVTCGGTRSACVISLGNRTADHQLVYKIR